MTTALQLIPADAVLEKIADLSAQVRTLSTSLENYDATSRPQWLPRRKLAALFGMSPRSADMYIASGISANALRVIRPRDISGKTGHPIYNVADFEKFISRPA